MPTIWYSTRILHFTKFVDQTLRFLKSDFAPIFPFYFKVKLVFRCDHFNRYVHVHLDDQRGKSTTNQTKRRKIFQKKIDDPVLNVYEKNKKKIIFPSKTTLFVTCVCHVFLSINAGNFFELRINTYGYWTGEIYPRARGLVLRKLEKLTGILRFSIYGKSKTEASWNF